ncbi:MAG: hypothetical protein BGO76_06460 [Caedibacter sp. 38-128]|nr:MAG: hypothetical protein BGO76_06460 [Caedibacter sp. 38-128]
MKTLVHVILLNIIISFVATAKNIEIKLFNDPEAQALEIEKTLDFFIKAAQSGDKNAEYNVAAYYYFVPNNNKNIPKAVKMLHKLAEEGHPISQYILSNMYLSGENVEKNLQEGIKWLQKAADQGILEAQFYIGLLKYRGIWGIKKDVNQAIMWLEKAAKQKNSDAQYNLGIIYFKRGDKIKSLEYLRQAAAQGDTQAELFMRKSI